jgi:hypothetical protein
MLEGNAGIRFEITEVNTTTPTGTVEQVHEIGTTVGDVNIGTTDVAVSLYGYVGANSYQVNLANINNISGAGTGIDVKVTRNNAVTLSNVKVFMIDNLSTSNTLIVTPGATSSFLPASERITLQPQQGVGLSYGSQQTVGATSCVISIVGGAGSTYHKIYILGN